MTSDNGDFRKTGIATKLVHSGEIEDESFKAAVTPIYRATTYASDEELYSLIKKHGKTEDPDVEMTDEELKAFRYKIFYARGANPNVVAVQRKMATLEGCDDAVAASSGMGAI